MDALLEVLDNTAWLPYPSSDIKVARRMYGQWQIVKTHCKKIYDQTFGYERYPNYVWQRGDTLLPKLFKKKLKAAQCKNTSRALKRLEARYNRQKYKYKLRGKCCRSFRWFIHHNNHSYRRAVKDQLKGLHPKYLRQDYIL